MSFSHVMAPTLISTSHLLNRVFVPNSGCILHATLMMETVMKKLAEFDFMVILEHRGVPVIAGKNDLPAVAGKQLKMKFARKTQNETIDQIIDEVEGRSEFHLGSEENKEIIVEKLLYIISNPFWSIPVYAVKLWNRSDGKWVKASYQCVRWNVGVHSGVVVLCITTEGEIVFVDEFRHTMRHRAAISDSINGFTVPRYGLRTELVRGLLIEDKSTGELEKPEVGALRVAANVAGVSVPEDAVVEYLGNYDADTGVLCQHSHVVLVKGVEVDATALRPDVAEAIYGPKCLSVAEVLKMMDKDEIRCGFAHHAVLRAMIRGHISVSEVSNLAA